MIANAWLTRSFIKLPILPANRVENALPVEKGSIWQNEFCKVSQEEKDQKMILLYYPILRKLYVKHLFVNLVRLPAIQSFLPSGILNKNFLNTLMGKSVVLEFVKN